MSASGKPFELSVPKRILVIGGGACGLVALRNLKERGNFEHVELYERRDDVGGVWYFDEPDSSTHQGKPRWPSPAYKGLIGNVLPEFLSFSGFPFAEPPASRHQPFPTLTETHQYLQNFAEPFIKSGVIKLHREVIRVVELGVGKGWRVTSRDWSEGNGTEVEELWDAVVVAVASYDNPVWPETEGLEELRKRGLAKHAKVWRGPQGCEGKKAIVIANANSANDIAAQLAPVANSPVWQSIRRPAFPPFVSLPDERIKMVAPVSKYILKDEMDGDKFDALLSDGTLLTDLDIVQVGAGYRIFPDFIHVLDPSSPGQEKHIPIINDNINPHRVQFLHRLTMYAYNPSLAFIGAPIAFTPFIIADVVSTWIALAWSGEAPYPDTVEGRLVYEQERMAGIEKWRSTIDDPSSLMDYNVLGYFDEPAYGAAFRADIVKARPELDAVLPIWNEERTAARDAMYNLKLDALLYAKEHAEN